MLREFRADLHVHTCLSPCCDLGMYPTAIIQGARNKGIDLIGICDHNSAENADAVIMAAASLWVNPTVAKLCAVNATGEVMT